jgi:hypothetical protein
LPGWVNHAAAEDTLLTGKNPEVKRSICKFGGVGGDIMPKRTATLQVWVFGWSAVSILCAFTSTEAGTIAAEVAAFLAVAGAVIVVRRWWQHQHRAFKMEFTENKYECATQQYAKAKTLQVGKHSLLLRVRPLEGMEFTRINLRFVQRRRLCKWLCLKSEWTDAPLSIISIDDLCDREQQREQIKTGYGLERWPDKVGGFYGQYTPPYPRRQEDSLWLEISVDAKDQWRGYLSFEGSLDGRRRYARNLVAVINSPQ